MRALYERAYARTYGPRQTVLEDWRLYQDGIVGSYRVARVGHDERDTTSLGPVTYERGVLHGIHWEQDANGVTYTYPDVHEQKDALSEHDLRDPADDRDVHLLGESPDLDAYVVEVNPPAGRHAWYYIERRSGYLVRTERVRYGRRFITDDDDIRLVDGVPEPSRVRTVDALGNERDQILVSRTVEDVPVPSAIEIPPTRHPLEIPTGVGPIRLPMRMVDGLPVVRTIVGRTAYDFLLDSGSSGIVVDPSVVDQQGFEHYGRHFGATLGTFTESTTVLSQLTVGELRMRDVVARVASLPFRPDAHTKIAGLLGFDFFADAIVHVDLPRGIVDVVAPERWHPPADASALSVGLTDRTQSVHLRVGSGIGRVVLDTGANRSLFVNTFADRADFGTERIPTVTRVRAIGGVSAAETTHVSVIDLAGIEVRDPTVDVTSGSLGADDLDGIVGTDVLREVELWFDDRTGTIYVRRAPISPVPLPTRSPLRR